MHKICKGPSKFVTWGSQGLSKSRVNGDLWVQEWEQGTAVVLAYNRALQLTVLEWEPQWSWCIISCVDRTGVTDTQLTQNSNWQYWNRNRSGHGVLISCVDRTGVTDTQLTQNSNWQYWNRNRSGHGVLISCVDRTGVIDTQLEPAHRKLTQ